jgi:phosphohistidine phosphatase SixA
MDRRSTCMGLLALPLTFRSVRAAEASGDQEVLALLRRGGVVLALRHARAPGTYDPPNFRLGDCSTQRNLNEEGRSQARRLGEHLRARQLRPARVRTSPWCRCVDTAELAFGSAEPWAALGSPVIGTEATNAASLAQLQQALAEAAQRPRQFEVWVTHMFVLGALADGNVSSGEGLVLAPDERGQAKVLGRLTVAG